MLLFARELDSGGHAAVSRCLLSYGADVRRRNNTGETPLDRCRGTEVELVIRDTATKGYVFMILFKDGAYYCYCAYVLRISRYSDFLSPMLTNTGIFLRGLKLSGESRS